MKKVEKEVVYDNETIVFIINEKDIALFENAKENCWLDIYFLIEGLEFMQVEFEIAKWEERK